MTILAVPFNTVTSMTDSTLILEPGDHPFINRKTAISFDLMLEIEVDKLEKLDQLNSSGQAERFRRNTAALIDLLNRIIEGALKSDITPKKMLKSLKARLGINLIAESV